MGRQSLARSVGPVDCTMYRDWYPRGVDAVLKRGHHNVADSEPLDAATIASVWITMFS